MGPHFFHHLLRQPGPGIVHGKQDTFQIQVEVRPEYYSDEMNKMLALKKKITNRIQSVVGLQPDIKIVEPRSIERSMGKAKHVIDKRKLS